MQASRALSGGSTWEISPGCRILKEQNFKIIIGYFNVYYSSILDFADGPGVKNLPAMQELQRHKLYPQVQNIPWWRQRQPTPVFLSGEFHGQWNLVGYSPWGCKESDITERLSRHTHANTADEPTLGTSVLHYG